MAELEQWPVDEPSAGFADRVMTAVMAERAAKVAPKRAAWWAAAGILAVAAVLALVFVRSGGGPSSGSLVATERRELSVGGRAQVVAEKGARLSWSGGVVTQSAGDVFYRVDKGTQRFAVRTPAGEIEVHGTCFDVKVREEAKMNKRDVAVGVVGATLSAMVFVGVYEGKVRLSHAGQSVNLKAGESGTASGSGVRASGPRQLAEQQFDDDAAPELQGRTTAILTERLRQADERLARAERQRAELEKQLKATAEMATAGSEASQKPAFPKSRGKEFDLSQTDWEKLAEQGAVKFRVPCARPGGWKPNPETMQKLGLAPDDAQLLQDAMKRSNDRIWDQIKPLCAKIVGEVAATKLGSSTCTHTIIDDARAQSPEAATEAQRQVAEMRAGRRALPAEGEAVPPVTQLLLLLTSEMTHFEGDLAQSMGPDEAHRVAFSDDFCASNSHFGGPGPRK